jgi:hypothetical protein
MDSHPWELMNGESALAFSGFEIFRKLGPDRTVEEAWRQYWSRPGTRRKRGDNTSPPRVMPYFSKWAVQWEWRKRALAWDAEQAAIERDQRLDRELREKAKEHQEELRQRQLRKEEAWAARAVARRALLRILKEVENGQFERMSVPELLPHLQKISALLETGQRLDRLYQGEPTEVVQYQQRFSPQLMERLGEVLRRHVPPERWNQVAEELIELDSEPFTGA